MAAFKFALLACFLAFVSSSDGAFNKVGDQVSVTCPFLKNVDRVVPEQYKKLRFPPCLDYIKDGKTVQIQMASVFTEEPQYCKTSDPVDKEACKKVNASLWHKVTGSGDARYMTYTLILKAEDDKATIKCSQNLTYNFVYPDGYTEGDKEFAITFAGRSAEYLEPIYFVDGDIYSTSILRAPIHKFGPQNAFRRQLSINEADDFAGPWVSAAVETEVCREGTADASSWYDDRFLPLRVCSESWATKKTKNKDFPVFVWIYFTSAIVVKRISFSSRKWETKLKQSPTKFDIVGSDDCSSWKPLMKNIVTKFTKVSQTKEWVIPKKNRAPFKCIGIQINEVNDEEDEKFAAIANLRIWRESSKVQQCDPNWKAWNDKPDDPKDCSIYAQKNYCTKDGKKGTAFTWDFEDYTNLQSGGGKTAFVCPQCGCKETAIWIDFENSGEIIAKFSFRNRKEKGLDKENPLEFKLFGADNCSVLGHEQHCDPNWKSEAENSELNCTYYANADLCTENGGYGKGWRPEWGNFESHANKEGKTGRVCPQCGCKEESFRRIVKEPKFVNKVIFQEYSVSADKWIGNDMEMTFPVDPNNRQTKRCVGIEIKKSSGGFSAAIQNIKMWTHKRIEGIHRLVKKTQMLEMLVLNILDTLESRVVCQTGNVGCKPCGAKDKNDNYITFYERYPVTFSPSFKKVPKVTMAVNYFYSIASGGRDWYHYKTVAKKVTIDGFEANLELGDAEIMGFGGTWIACGVM